VLIPIYCFSPYLYTALICLALVFCVFWLYKTLFRSDVSSKAALATGRLGGVVQSSDEESSEDFDTDEELLAELQELNAQGQ
jgi:hypothetical protein